MTDEIKEFKNYRKAQVMTKELGEILSKFHQCKSSLKPYFKYAPVKEVLASLVSAELFVDMCLAKAKEVVESKGKTNEVKSIGKKGKT